MCGIVGYTARDASPIILNGLRRLDIEAMIRRALLL